jgi:hypothetical protein
MFCGSSEVWTEILMSKDPWWNGADYLISVQTLAVLAVGYLKDGRLSERA